VPRAERCGFDGFWEAADTLEYTSRPYEGRVFDADGRPVEFRGQYRADFLTDRAIGFMERRRDDRPFFMFLSYIEPHQQNDMGRFIAPEGYAERYANPWVPPDLRDRPGDWVSSLPDYYGCVARLDECLGRLLAWLDAHGQAERTIVVFTSDHGCHFRTRNREYKRCAHESAIRIPLVVAGPGFDTGRVAPEMASLVDVPPTLLDAARIAPPATFQGRSLASLAQGPVADWPEEVLVQISAAELGRAIRTGRWKYSVFAPDRDPNGDASSLVYVERYLYDLAADPHETVNLAGRPGAYREAADELMHALKRRMREAGEQEPEIVPARYYA
jgi:arylsulfatase A-like enzyme